MDSELPKQPQALEHAAQDALPAWLLDSETYAPSRDRDAFLRKSLLSLTSVLARMRLDVGQATPLSPSAPVKLALALILALLLALSSNFIFVVILTSVVLVREALLPIEGLRRCLATSLAATGLCVLIMLPAVLLGQAHSILLVGTKVLTSTSIIMTCSVTTPAHELTAALRSYHVPDAFIMMVELALKSIVDLGQTALEVATALNLRSVGHDQHKTSSLGGVMGVTFLKAADAAQATSDAMRCRGFEGHYPPSRLGKLRPADLVWLAGLMLLILLFCYLERAV